MLRHTDGLSRRVETDAERGTRSVRKRDRTPPVAKLTPAQRHTLDTYLSEAVTHADLLVRAGTESHVAPLRSLRDELESARERNRTGTADTGKLLNLLSDVANEWFGLGIAGAGTSFHERRQRSIVARCIGRACELVSSCMPRATDAAGSST